MMILNDSTRSGRLIIALATSVLPPRIHCNFIELYSIADIID